jgi:hypothetical protein
MDENNVIDFERKPEQKIVDPTKEIQADEKDLEEIKNLERKYAGGMDILSTLRFDFLSKEKRIFDSLSALGIKLDTQVKGLYTKYKIVGQIHHFDYDNKKIILK